MKVLILGITGMLGSTLFKFLQQQKQLQVFGSARSYKFLKHFSALHAQNVITDVNVEDHNSLLKLFARTKPDLVINCVGIVKQLASSNDPLQSIPINSLLPHQLALLCQSANARFIHISTDCVFSGNRGNYRESDLADAYDLYGRSKLMGEVDYENAITLRTSIIGHELSGNRSLIDWFLSQNGKIKGYSKAIYSGVPTVELSQIILNYVIPNIKLKGLYHVAADPINKFQLLSLVKDIYNKDIEIIQSDELIIDRSLNRERFSEATGYIPSSWPELIKKMHNFNQITKTNV